MAKKRKLANLFFRNKPIKILTGLKSLKSPVYVTMLSKEADCTYSHTIKILDAFQNMGIVEFEKKGRIKEVILTDSGSDIAQKLDTLQEKFTKIEDGVSKKKK